MPRKSEPARRMHFFLPYGKYTLSCPDDRQSRTRERRHGAVEAGEPSLDQAGEMRLIRAAALHSD